MLKTGDIYNGKYEVISVIGVGGMGRVLLVRDNQLGSLWALKETSKAIGAKETPASNKRRLEGVLAEAKMLSSLRNANIPRVTEISETEDYIYILQDYIEGVTLKEKLDSTRNYKIKEYLQANPDKTIKSINNKFVFRQMSKSEFLKTARKVAEIFKYLHSFNPPVIYRDLKPENIMVDQHGNIKLIDFGTAYALTPENMKPGAQIPLGTKGYAAPEQYIHGAVLTTQTDIFNYGKLLYELMSGIVPSLIKNGKSIELPPLKEVRPDIDEGIEKIIMKCTKKEVSERYNDFNEIIYALDHYRELGVTYRSKLKKRMKQVILLSSTALACLTLAGVLSITEGITTHRAYESMISQADMYTNVQDLIPVIQQNPKETRPVERLIDLYEKDNKFTVEEEQEFINLLSPNIALLKENSKYGDLAFKVGQLYIFYYDVSDKQDLNYQMRLSQATQWFKDAVDYKSDNKDTAKVFYNLGVFNRDINSAQAQLSDKGMYKEYFKNLQALIPEYDNPKVTNYAKVQISNIICNTIEQYRKNLEEDGINKSVMINLLDESKAKFDKINLGNSQRAKDIKSSTQDTYNKTYNFMKG